MKHRELPSPSVATWHFQRNPARRKIRKCCASHGLGRCAKLGLGISHGTVANCRVGVEVPWWVNRARNRRCSVPRHSEIWDLLANKICKDLDMPRARRQASSWGRTTFVPSKRTLTLRRQAPPTHTARPSRRCPLVQCPLAARGLRLRCSAL